MAIGQANRLSAFEVKSGMLELLVASYVFLVNRAFDIAIAGAGLIVSSPLVVFGAVVVKLEDRGPVLYKQARVGKDGVDFELLKLRTMIVGAETKGAGFAVDKGDSRITKVGRGPITAMSPRTTFQSCGSSSMLIRRSTRPTFVIRESPLSTAYPAPCFSAPTTMVRSFSSSKSAPSLPTRVCR